MLYLIVAALGAGIVLVLLQLRHQRNVVRELSDAIVKKQPLVRENQTAAQARGDFELLRTAANALISECTQLNEIRTGQLAQLEATLGSLQEAVLIVDADNRILLANHALQAIFPRARNIINQRLETVLHSVAFIGYVESVRSGNAEPQREIEFVDEGDSVWLEVTGTLVAQVAGPPGAWALFVLHDITTQKRLEAIRKDFVANVSHELRTPLSIIKGYVETLADGHQDMPLPDRDRFLRTIQKHTERLNSLVEDLLTLSRLESSNPGLRRESTDLGELLTALIDDFQSRSSSSGHALSSDIDPTIGPVFIDPLKITQVCENLLDNAFKYTPQGSHVEVTTRLLDGEVEVCVRDNGPGIPPSDLPHLFERFYRVDKGRSREKGGTGLGLSIVKHIVQLHGGRVWVDSEIEKGTAFFFTLPLRTT